MIASQLVPRVSSNRAGRATGLLALLVLVPSLLLSSPALGQDEPAVNVSAPDTSAAPGDTVAIPIRVSNLDEAADVTNYEIEFEFGDESVVSYSDFEAENTLSSVIGSIIDNPETPGIFASGTNVINDEADGGEGVLIRVLFEVESEGSTTVTLVNTGLNPGSPPPIEPSEPQFTLTGATAAPPEASDDSYSVLEDSTLSVGAGSGVLANDTTNVGSLTASVTQGVSNGSLTFNPDGSFEYVPAEDFNGTDSLVYEAENSEGTDQATATITVEPVNDLPQFTVVPEDGIVAVGDTLATTVDAEDPDGDEVSFSLTEAPQNAAIDSASGDFTFAPEQSQADSTYGIGVRASDGQANSDTSFAVTVMAANTPPEVSVPPPDITLEVPGPNRELTGLEQSVFTDPDGDELSLSASSSNSSAVSIVSGGDPLVLGPEAVGEAEITVTATDSAGSSVTATFQAVVQERPDDEDVPAEQSSAVVAASESGDAEASFGGTGVGASFQDVQGSGTVTVGFVPDSSASGDPSFSESFENVSGYRWDIDNAGADFGTADVAFSLEDADVVGVEAPSTVTVLVADGPGGTFETVSTEYDPDNEVLVAEGLTSFSTFRLASDSSDNPLPVEMAAFTATGTESGALLKWRTASETGNAGFEVQHQGPGAPGFEREGFVEGSGTTTSPQSYQYRLSGLEPGTHRFRLKQRDTDGSTSLTDPVVLSIEAERALTLEATGSNPVRQETRLTFTVKQTGPAKVDLYNVLGQQVRTLFRQTATAGERHAVEVNASGLPTGKYFARLSGPTGTRTQQVVIVR